MLNQWVRVLYSDNGTITDYSIESQDRTSTIPVEIVADEDYIYIGQYYPFNNLYFKVDTANTNSSAMSIDYWSSNDWVSAVDILDATSSGGKTLAQSGVVQWSTDIDESGWQYIDDPADESSLGFSNRVYDLYWIRISVSNDLSAAVLSQITYKFCTDSDINSLAPDIERFLTSWEAGKTDWDEQILEGSKQVVIDLKSRGIIKHHGQILRFDEVNIPTVYKTLSLIYQGIGGEAFFEMANEMNKNYYKTINKTPITTDLNRDGLVSRGEISIKHGRTIR